MTDWHSLKHAYGPASDIPGLLGQLTPDANAPVWGELWSRLCHQMAVYSASFPAIPHLLAAARQWRPDQRGPALDLAGAIVAFSDSPAAIAEQDLSDFAALALESLQVPLLSVERFVAAQQAVLAFRGEQLWGQQLDRILSGEFEGTCPHCGKDLLLVVGSYGCFVTEEEWVNRPAAGRHPVTPAASTELPNVGRWLHDTATAHEQLQLASWYLNLFGSAVCPQCAKSFRLPPAIQLLVA